MRGLPVFKKNENYQVGNEEMDTFVEYSTLSQASGHSSSQFEVENESRCDLKHFS